MLRLTNSYPCRRLRRATSFCMRPRAPEGPSEGRAPSEDRFAMDRDPHPARASPTNSLSGHRWPLIFGSAVVDKRARRQAGLGGPPESPRPAARSGWQGVDALVANGSFAACLQGHAATLSRAPSGTSPKSTKRHRATKSFRARATMPTRRLRLAPELHLSWNHFESALSGW